MALILDLSADQPPDILGSYPAAMRTGPWQWTWTPTFASNSMPEGSIILFCFNSYPGNLLQLEDAGSGVCEVWLYCTEGPLSFAISFSASQAITFALDPSTGAFDVSGATSGNGSHPFGGAFTLESGQLAVGRRFADLNNAFSGSFGNVTDDGSEGSTVAMAGTGTLAAAPSITSALAGAGALSAAPRLSATLSGAGALAAVPSSVNVATLAGSGSLSAAGQAWKFASAALSGAGSLAGAGQAWAFASAALSGAGALAAVPLESSAAALAGSGSLSAAGQAWKFAAAALSGGGSLAAAWAPPYIAPPEAGGFAAYLERLPIATVLILDTPATPDSGGFVGIPGLFGAGASTESLWSPLSVLSIVNPMDFGAVGDGVANDQAAIAAAITALPASGGVVFFPPGRSFKKTSVLSITKDHVKLWAVNREAEIFQSVGGTTPGAQAMAFRNATGAGCFGIKFRSDATVRRSTFEDAQIGFDHCDFCCEVVGCEIDGAATVGVMCYGSSDHFIEHNYVHHTYADHIHHTNAAHDSTVWGNWIYNAAPSLGDDGVACVTYGAASTRVLNVEIFENRFLGSGNGRGYAIVGADNVSIHDNWAIGAAAAGILIASESGYDSASSQDVTIERNYVYNCCHVITSHAGILIAGDNPGAVPLDDIALTDNVSYNPLAAQPYRTQGDFTDVTNVGLLTSFSDLPSPIPGVVNVAMADTTVLRTRDTSHVSAGLRPGLYRIHVRRDPQGSGFQERFEYLVKGTPSAVLDFIAQREAANDYLSAYQVISGLGYALLLCKAPVSIGSLTGVTFAELRTAPLAQFWLRVDSGGY